MSNRTNVSGPRGSSDAGSTGSTGSTGRNFAAIERPIDFPTHQPDDLFKILQSGIDFGRLAGELLASNPDLSRKLLRAQIEAAELGLAMFRMYQNTPTVRMFLEPRD